MMGLLTLLTLPLGNLEDLTQRARRALDEGVYFAVEDTRTFKSLLAKLGISPEGKKIYSYFDHSGPQREEFLLNILREGETLYLASEAGGPLFSDPGLPLVQRALAEDHQITTFPGASALLVALELSGLPPYPFHFHGFFPRDREREKLFLGKLQSWEGTHVFFEAPPRVLSTLDRLSGAFPMALFAVGRELTKKFETVYRFKGEEWAGRREEVTLKGEFTLVVYFPPQKGEGAVVGPFAGDLEKLAEEILKKGPRKKEVAKLVGKILKRNVKDLYEEWSQSP